MKKLSFVILGLTLGFFTSKAQVENITPTASPNAASIGLYGQIPVDLYTGMPQIAIPLYTYKSRDISVPIGLSYHAANFRPGDHASWVGLGWSLQAGGVITRIQNDLPDEMIDYTYSTPIQRGFFYNYSLLSASTWDNFANLQAADINYANELVYPTTQSGHIRPDYAPDEFQFNFMGMSGSLLMGQDGAWHLKSQQGLNFTVTTEVGPYAVWEPNLNPQLNDRNYPSLVRNCLTRFILTAADGTAYYFGSDPAANTYGYNTPTSLYQYFTTPDSNSVEFSRVGTGAGNGSASARDGGTVPMSWYLTKIKSATGDSVVFRYTRDGPQINASTATFGTFYTCSGCTPAEELTYGAGDIVTITDGSTLSSISGANGSIQFGKSQANVLDYTLLGAPSSPQNEAWDFPSAGQGLYEAYAYEIFQNYGSSNVKSVFMELDNMKVVDNYGNPIKSYAFSYNKSSTNRMWLNSVTETGMDGSTLPPYTFSYNNIAGLNNVPYNTVQVDHWGYYTAKDPFTGLFISTGTEPTTLNPLTQSGNAYYLTNNTQGVEYFTVFDADWNAAYVANRAPVDGPLEYGILQQITYPTGGNTQFAWEPSQYSKYISADTTGTTLELSVQDLGTNVNGPGVRIHAITSQAAYNAPAVTKTYTYYRDPVHNNYTSSGVLNSAQPSYCDTFKTAGYLYRDWTNQNLNTANYTNGAPLTYTNVQENNSDGSYTAYTYTNHDNGYLDQPGDEFLIADFPATVPLLQQLDVTSLELERGLLLKEAKYGTGSVLLSQESKQYNNNPARWTSSINRYGYKQKFSLASTSVVFDGYGFIELESGLPLYFADFTGAYNVHYDYPYLQSDTLTRYDQNGNNPMTVVNNYTYDNWRNVKTASYTSSKNEPVVKTYNYANDAISGVSSTTQQAQTAMVQAGMVGIPLEQTETRSGTQTQHSRTDYQNFPAGFGMLVPGESWKSSYTAALDPLTQYINFDNLGNIGEYITRDGLSTCYDWGYNQSYPVVKITNASNTLHTYTVTNTSTSGMTTLTWAPGVIAGQNIPITLSNPGTFSFSGGFSEQPQSTDQVTFTVTLQGQGVYSNVSFGPFTICICGSGGTCGAEPGGSSFTNVPAGNYNLSVVPTTTGIGCSFNYSTTTYSTTSTTTGSKNYFYDGFEENSNVAVVSGTAHTGDMYWGGGSYTPGFTPPDNNAYTIEWWVLQGGNWVYQTQAYTAGMSITGPVDDVRIFPAGAMMSTYTYRPLVGMTSEIDPRGYTSYFTYDAFGRLSADLDKDRNVLKRYCYNYTGQSGSCPVYTPPPQETVNVNNTTNQANVVTFTNQTTNIVLTYSVPAGTQQLVKVPSGTYGVTISPANPTPAYPINFSVNGMPQTYYATVGYTNVSITGASTVTIAPPAEEIINATNTSTEAVTLSFNYNAGSYSYTYTFNVPPNSSGGIGSVPTGSYTVGMGPVSPNPAYPLVYSLNGMTQTYYALVGYGPPDFSITSTATVTITPPAEENIYVTNTGSEALTLSMTYNPGSYSYTYTFSIPAYGIGVVGTVPTGTYGITVGPVSPNQNYPLLYNIQGSAQQSYEPVTYSGVSITAQTNIAVGPPPPLPVVVTNSTNATITIQYTNTATNQVYTFTSSPHTTSTEIGTVPPGTYGVGMTPTSYSTQYPIVYNFNGAVQTYYAAVGFGPPVTVSGIQNITLSYPPQYGVYVTNTSNKTVTLTFTNAWGSSQVFTAQPGYSNVEVGSVFAGTYNVVMAPGNYSSSYPILWQIYNASQEYYATVVFGGVVVNSNCPINISFY